MFRYIASLGIIVGFFVGLTLIFLAGSLRETQKIFGVAKTLESRLKVVALLLLSFFLIIAGLLILKFKDISWAGEIVFGVVGFLVLLRLRYIKEEYIRIIWAIVGLLLLMPPLYWLWCLKF